MASYASLTKDRYIAKKGKIISKMIDLSFLDELKRMNKRQVKTKMHIYY